MLVTRRNTLIAIAATALGPVLPAAATTRPLLTVDGHIGLAQPVTFDRAALERLPTSTITTRTPWHDGPVTFQGPRVDALMAMVDARGDTAVVTALNDYVAEIPVEDFARHGVILAMTLNGAEMLVRDKGPLFVIYPYDSSPDLQTERIYARSVWQVRAITFR